VAPGHERNLVVPDLAADGGNGIAEGAVLFRRLRAKPDKKIVDGQAAIPSS
jgi:hypothetical protein